MNNPASAALGLIVILVVGYTTYRAWQIAVKYRPYKLPFILAIGNTIAGFIAVYWTTLAAFWPDDMEAPVQIIFINSALALLLLLLPAINTWYLIWLDRRRNGGSERRDDHDVESHRLY